MVEVFSRATKRLARTQSKLPHHSGPFPKQLDAAHGTECYAGGFSVMVLQTTETEEEAERVVRRQASLSSAKEVEGLSAQAESRAAQLKTIRPLAPSGIMRARSSIPWQPLPRWWAKHQLSLGWVIPIPIERKAYMTLERTVLGTGGVTRVVFGLTWHKGMIMRSTKCAVMLIQASCFRPRWQPVLRQGN